MKCPVDDTTMKTLTAYGATLDVCPLCYGVWFDNVEFKRAMNRFVIGKFPENMQTWQKVKERIKKKRWEEDTITCPLDSTGLKKIEYAGDSGIVMDHCIRCNGFWIDGDELKKLWDFLRPNPARDAIADTLATAMSWSRKRHEKDALTLSRFTYGLIHPPFLLFFALGILVKRILREYTGVEIDDTLS